MARERRIIQRGEKERERGVMMVVEGEKMRNARHDR